MFKAILFDLDGTLLKVNMDYFLQHYLKSLAQHVNGVFDPDEFIGHVLSATKTMIHEISSETTNKESFMAYFLPRVSPDSDEIFPLLDDFYSKVFPQLQVHADTFPGVEEIMEQAVKLQCPLVLATNPVFPMEAIRHRMHWAGLKDDLFCLVTAYENMHFCKPHREYYLEIASYLEIPPEECLMVGNDADDDIIAAARAGMKTYLVEDCLVNKSGREPRPDFRGYLSDLKTFLRGLPEDRIKGG
jgi:FMN phosphatase YigB (HAD superfamily)